MLELNDRLVVIGQDSSRSKKSEEMRKSSG